MTERKHYIDWVRVLAFFLLIFFHCAMPFVVFGWEIKNKEQSLALSQLIWWLHQWRLPLLFFISGVGIHFSLKKRSILSFAGERVRRLFVPLLFAMFFTIPLQVYFERLQKGQVTGSYASFYPTVWDLVPYPEGTLTWSHMWFVVYLFVFCLLLLPFFALFKTRFLQGLKTSLATRFAHPLVLPLLFVPLATYYFTLYLEYPEQQSLLDDWFLFVFSLTLLLYGYVMGGTERFWRTCEKYRYWFLGVALACLGFLYVRYWRELRFPRQKDAGLYQYGLLNAVHIWLLILAILGFAKKHLNFSNRFLRYTNQAVFPFYILHQTIIVAAGYFIVQWQISIAVKLLLLAIACFASTWLIYQWLIRPFALPRILFGLTPKERNPDDYPLQENHLASRLAIKRTML
jgi:glucans biosynthesis protein C